MTHAELAAELAALEAHLDTVVELWRVIVNADGTPTGRRYYRGSFSMPPDWQPPSLEQLLAGAKGSD